MKTMGIVHCVACTREFQQMYKEEHTGSRCAGYLENGELFFGFGSIFDFTHWKVLDHDTLTPNGRVCDFCMPRLVDEGKIAFSHTHLGTPEFVEFELQFIRDHPESLLGDDYWDACDAYHINHK